MARRNIITLFPFLLVTLAGVVGVELFYSSLEKFMLEPVENQRTVREAAPETAPLDAGGQAAQQIDYSSITRRNLFGPPPSATAGPAEETPAVEEELEATTLEVVLMGTVGTEMDGARAIILKKKDRTQELYRVGDTVEGAQIKEIRRGRVILTVDGRDEMLDISEARQFAQGAMPVAAASATRRRPVVVAPQGAATAPELQPTPVARPLRRIVRPRAVPVAEPPESESNPADDAREEVAGGAQDQDVQGQETLEPEAAAMEEMEQDDVQDQEEGDVITQ